jgi:hypothetical protein
MDPDECLRRCKVQVARIRALQKQDRAGDTFELADAGQELADAFDELDEWLTKGGFAPNQWKPRPPVAPLPQSGE